MKLKCFAVLILGFSVGAFAECPRGQTGGSNFGEAVQAIQSTLGQSVRNGSEAYERVPADQQHKIKFEESNGKMQISLYQRAGEGWSQMIGDQAVEVCAAGRFVYTNVAGYRVKIWATNRGIAISANGTTFNFAAVGVKGTTVAREAGNGR